MKVAFYTLGCKVNQYETDIMIKEFMDKGYEVVKFTEKANIYVINSCSVTNMSTRKTRQYLSRAKNMGGIVVLVGCYAEVVKEESDIESLFRRGGTTMLKNDITGLEDFELIAFVVVV